MRIDVFKLTQNGSRGLGDIYITVFRAGDLVHKCKIDRRTPTNTSGYQRLPSERRLSMIRARAHQKILDLYDNLQEKIWMAGR